MNKKLRIAVFAYEFPALSETFVVNQVAGLVDRGHQVTIFAERPRKEAILNETVTRYGLYKITRYPRVPANKAVRLLKGLLSGISSPYRNYHSLFRACNGIRFGRDAWSLRLLYWAKLTIRHEPFDIVYCHFGPMGRLAARLRAIGALNGKIVTVFHGVDMSASLRRNPDIYRHLFTRGDLFLPISENWRRRLISLGCPREKTAVHHMGVEIPKFSAFRSPLDDARALHIVTVGRMVEKKGIEFGLRAVAALKRKEIPVRYSIVGDGPLRSSLEQLCRELGIADRVRLLGWQTAASVQALLRACDILLAPSVTDATGDQEGIPVVLMEAMAIGVPVVSTNHSGIPELVEDGICGFLVSERDWVGLASAIEELIRNPGVRVKVGRAGRERVRSRFNIAELNDQLEMRFLDLLASDSSDPKVIRENQPDGRHHRRRGAHA